MMTEVYLDAIRSNSAVTNAPYSRRTRHDTRMGHVNHGSNNAPMTDDPSQGAPPPGKSNSGLKLRRANDEQAVSSPTFFTPPYLISILL